MTSLLTHVTSTGWFGTRPFYMQVSGTGYGGANWPANNRAIYVPIALTQDCTLQRFYMVQDGNGTGTNDIGLYSSAGTKLISTGAQTRTANICQYYSVTATPLTAGDYYLAALGTSTTGVYTSHQFSNVGILAVIGILQEAVGAATLPSSMTPATPSSGVVPMFGFSTSTTL